MPEVPDGYIPDTDPSSYGVGKCAADIPGMTFTNTGSCYPFESGRDYGAVPHCKEVACGHYCEGDGICPGVGLLR